jgi:hypothetical protein
MSATRVEAAAFAEWELRSINGRLTDYSPFILAALTIGHHFSISAF